MMREMNALRNAALLTLAVAATASGACAADAVDPGPADRSAADELRAAAASPRDVRGLRIFATGDTRGFLEPCGCESDQKGGIARRRGYLDAVGRAGDLRLDLGNAGAGTGAARRQRIASAFETLGTEGAVFVPGRSEVSAGADFADVARTRATVRVVCANLHDASGAAVFPAWTLHVAPDGMRVAVIGLTEPTAAPATPAGAPWTVGDPLAAARRAIADARDTADVVVVAAAMPWTSAAELAASLDGADLVVAGTAGDLAPEAPLLPPTRGAPFVAAGNRGEYVLRVDFEGRRPVAAWRAWLVEGLPEDAEMLELAKRHRAVLSSLDPEFVPDVLDGLRGRGFVGSEACAGCHAEEHAIWAATGHAHAMETLAARASSRDPECVPCHLVDVAWADGAPLAPDASGVGCEACHGGGAKHAATAMDGQRPPATTPRRARPDDCRGCHHPPEVTRFDFDAAWPRIAHGRGAAPPKDR